MRFELHKVTFQIHGLLRDDTGKIIQEVHVGGGQAPNGQAVEFLLWEHQLDELPAEVKRITEQLLAQAITPEQSAVTNEGPEPAPAHLQQRRARARAKSTRAAKDPA